MRRASKTFLTRLTLGMVTTFIFGMGAWMFFGVVLRLAPAQVAAGIGSVVGFLIVWLSEKPRRNGHADHRAGGD